MAQHTSFRCFNCNKFEWTKQNLRNHRFANGELHLVCDDCIARFEVLRDFVAASRTREQLPRYDCGLDYQCGLTMRDELKNRYLDHLRDMWRKQVVPLHTADYISQRAWEQKPTEVREVLLWATIFRSLTLDFMLYTQRGYDNVSRMHPEEWAQIGRETAQYLQPEVVNK